MLPRGQKLFRITAAYAVVFGVVVSFCCWWMSATAPFEARARAAVLVFPIALLLVTSVLLFVVRAVRVASLGAPWMWSFGLLLLLTAADVSAASVASVAGFACFSAAATPIGLEEIWQLIRFVAVATAYVFSASSLAMVLPRLIEGSRPQPGQPHTL